MATEAILEEEDDKKVQPGQEQEDATSPVTQTTAATVAPGQGSAAQGAASPAATPAANKPSSSGSFTDVGKYYEAGKKSAQDQSQGLAGSLSGGVTSATSALNKAGSDYRSGLDQYKAKNVWGGKDTTGVDQSAFGDIFKNKDLGTASYGSSKADLDTASKRLQDTSSFGGQQAALRNLAADVGGYSAGEGRLDTALTGRSERDTGALAKAREQYAGAGGLYDTDLGLNKAAREGVVAQRSDMQQQAKDWLKERQGAIQGEVTAADQKATLDRQNALRAQMRGAWNEGQQSRLDASNARKKAKWDAQQAKYMESVKAVDEARSQPIQTGVVDIDRMLPPDYYKRDTTYRGYADWKPGSNMGGLDESASNAAFERAMGQLGGKGFDVGSVTGRAELGGNLGGRSSQYEALARLAGADGGISRGQASNFDEAAAMNTVRGLSGAPDVRKTALSRMMRGR